MKGYKRHDFYIRVKRAGEPSLEKHTGGYLTVRWYGVTYACERQPVEGGALRWNVWHVLTGLRVNTEPLRTSQDVEDFLTKLDHARIVKLALGIFERYKNTKDFAFFEAYASGIRTLGTEQAEREFHIYEGYGSANNLL